MYHLVLLAKNDTGYKNLLKIVTDANENGFYRKPRTDDNFLESHAEGIVALSACMQGRIPQLILDDKYEEAKEQALKYNDFFDEFYLEVQPHSITGQQHLNQTLQRMSEETGIPLVATADAHYVKKEDAYNQEVLMAISMHNSMNDKDRFRLSEENFWIKSIEEFKEYDIPDEAIKNTKKIADQCNLELELEGNKYPEYPDINPGETEEDFLRRLVDQKFIEFVINDRIPDPEKYYKRLQYELDIITDKGYPGYFLIVRDFIIYGEEQGILMGPGRGSAAGSLVSYLIGITKIDPIKYGLIFERFLNPERESPPDIDQDVPDDHREELIDYIKQKYGHDRVAQIITFGYMLGKTAIKDVFRVFDMDFDDSNKITEVMGTGELLSDELDSDNEKLKEYYEEYEDLFDIATAIENVPRQTGVHAAGVIVAPDDITNYIPLKRNPNGEMMLTQFEYPVCEEMGLLKIDLLGLKTLSIINNTMQNIDDDFDPYNMPLDDPKVYDLFKNGETTGVFQFASSSAKQLLKSIRPNEFSELIDINAMNRPGPLNNGFDKTYKENRAIAQRPYEKIKYPHPDLEPIYKDTYGVMLYQEQILEIAQVIAGYTPGAADSLRKAVGKKKIDVMNKEKEKFVSGALENGYNKKFVEELWETIVEFASYGFNKSHSAAYTLLSYLTAYLKVYYPAEFMASLLSSYSGDPDKVVEYLGEAKRLGIDMLPPDINRSSPGFTVDDGKIRFGLVSVKQVGDSAIGAIMEARPFDDLADAYEKGDNRKLHKGVYDNMIKAGMFDSYKENRIEVLRDYYELRGDKMPEEHNVPWNKQTRLEFEKEYLGFYVTGHPLDGMPHVDWDELQEGQEVDIAGVINKVKTITTRRGNPMAFLTLETQTYTKDVVVFNSVWQKRKERCKKDNIVVVRGKKDTSRDRESFIANDILNYTKDIKPEKREEIENHRKALF